MQHSDVDDLILSDFLVFLSYQFYLWSEKFSKYLIQNKTYKGENNLEISNTLKNKLVNFNSKIFKKNN
jgi:hypothetical protein